MLFFLRQILSPITMYRLILYLLLSLLTINILLCFLNILPYNPFDIILTGFYLVAICNITNYLFAKLFRVKTNLESASITALILTLIVGPLSFYTNIPALTLIASLAMVSKYILVFRGRNIFNPAAIAIFISALVLKVGASWWVGNNFTIPLLFIGGMLILVKINRIGIVVSFLSVYFLISFLNQTQALSGILNSSLLFFTFVMLVEPATSPSTKKLQILIGTFVALTYFIISNIIPDLGLGLETALLAGNLLTMAIAPSFNMVFELRKKEEVAKNTWSFYFKPKAKFKFTPGQYVELTYPHKNPDSRGTRRYFTIASSPKEKYVVVTMRVSEKNSSFKNAMLKMNYTEQIIASSPQGEFILPKDKNIPLCFIAGGIGITPFRSIIKFLLANKEKRNIVLLFANNTTEDIAFKEVFESAKGEGIITFYKVADIEGYIDEKMIKGKVPDYKNRVFYISGPQPMVEIFQKMLSRMQVAGIKTDFFPGYIETHQK